MNQKIRDYALLVFAGVIYAIALKYFVLPTEVILTGTEGIAAALSYYFESESLFILLYVVFQVALLAFAYLRFNKVFAVRSAIVIVTVVLCLMLMPELQFGDPGPTNERLILVIFGGLIAGAAKALAFRRRGSTGDEDIPGAYFASKYLKPVGYIAIFSATISTTFGIVLALLKTGEIESAVNTLMYTCIYIFASAETLNTLYRKFHLSMLVVLTRIPAEVGEAIVQTESHRTYTVQTGVGGRSGRAFHMLRTIVTHEELPEMIEAVEGADADCFYYHHDVEGVSQRYYITPIGHQA